MWLQALKTRAASGTVKGLMATAEGREGLLQGLEACLKGDKALKAQLAALVAEKSGRGPGSGIFGPRRHRIRR